MSNQARHAFYVGRAFAEVLGERVEDTVTNTLSELGTLEAKQREALQEFVDDVMTRAEQNESQGSSSPGTTSTTTTSSANFSAPKQRSPEDVQEMIDELRAAIASLRTELNAYKSDQKS